MTDLCLGASYTQILAKQIVRLSDITFVIRGNEGKEDLPSYRSISRNRPKCNSSLR